MSEMIERVAREIHTERYGGQVKWGDNPAADTECLEEARAAIEAMREPTDEMMEVAASEFTFQSGNWGPDTTPEKIQRAVFQRAIDAALSEEP